jgi:hopene-associated glycosyltransferase HpnB
MADLALLLSSLAFVIWLITALLPWQPWRNREVLEPLTDFEQYPLEDVTVLIPARNEAEMIAGTLEALKHQGRGLTIILVDDDSEDETVSIAQKSGLENLSIIESKTLPDGWTGKLWAQQQGLEQVKTPRVLLLDADIALKPGMLKALKQKQQREDVQFVSLMAVLRFQSFWEKMLMPAFIYFFKMIYPFALANNPHSKVAAAAGGCILLETQVVREIGGVAAIKDAVIDDCTLAQAVKSAGYKTWVGLTHGVISQRPYVGLDEIWQMVTRTAFTQLRYSVVLLLLCTWVMLLLYWWPLLGIFMAEEPMQLFFNGVSLLLMMLLYLPTLVFYRLNPGWVLTMPIVAALYLMMTWHSAVRYWRGERSRWKGRSYLTDQ